jgi:putative endonuclease
VYGAGKTDHDGENHVGASKHAGVCMKRGGWVYIMTNRPNGILYIGVTSDLARRVYDHREGALEGFMRKHGLKRLVWYEWHDDIVGAIQREKSMKRWLRAWKTRTIRAINPDWRELYEELA